MRDDAHELPVAETYRGVQIYGLQPPRPLAALGRVRNLGRGAAMFSHLRHSSCKERRIFV